MGYPHKPHPKETAVLSRYFGDPDARSYKGWVKRGGYEAWKQAQTMAPAAITEAGCAGAVAPASRRVSSGRSCPRRRRSRTTCA